MRQTLLRRWLLQAAGVMLFLVAVFLVRGATAGSDKLGSVLRMMDSWIVDQSGQVIWSSGKPFPREEWRRIPTPAEPGEIRVLDGSSWMRFTGVVRLDPQGTRFRVFRRVTSIPEALVFVVLYVLPFVLLWAVPMFAIFVWYLRKNGRLAAQVIRRLREGDLRARFPVGPLDEIGEMMRHFNEMAEEIERLVNRLREAEKARSQLLQELAHDLQTPLTAVLFQIETVADLAETLSPAAIREKMTVATQEMEYFKRLLEDLFLLEQVNDPAFSGNRETFSLWRLIEEEAQQLRDRLRDEARAITILPIRAGEEDVELTADRHLFKRLVRNALDNAVRFAKQEVFISLRAEAEGLSLSVRDDGPGFSAEALQHFGKKRSQRYLQTEGRSSLGLGSVIMRTIAERQGGQLQPGNWHGEDGRARGGEIRITLPSSISQHKPRAA